jgi:hypothetical protein
MNSRNDFHCKHKILSYGLRLLPGRNAVREYSGRQALIRMSLLSKEFIRTMGPSIRGDTYYTINHAWRDEDTKKVLCELIEDSSFQEIRPRRIYLESSLLVIF